MSPEPITIIVDGPPQGKGRPRFVRRGHKVVGVTPNKTVNYEAVLNLTAQSVMGGRPPLEGPLRVVVTAFMPMARSWTKRATAEAIAGTKRPGKPDADNILKMIDALNGLVWVDDAQIADARVVKLYDDQPRLEIVVEAIAPAARCGREIERSA